MSKVQEELRKMIERGSDIMFDASEGSLKILRPPFRTENMKESYARTAVLRAVNSLLGKSAVLKVEPVVGANDAFKRTLAIYMHGRDSRFVVNTGGALVALNTATFEAARGIRINNDKNSYPERLDWMKCSEAIYNGMQIFGYHLAMLLTSDIDQANAYKKAIKGNETNPEFVKNAFLVLQPHPEKIVN